VKAVIETGVGTTAEACRALGLARSSYYRNSAMSTENRKLHGQIVELSQEHPRYGYRRVTALLRREGQEVNVSTPKRPEPLPFLSRYLSPDYLWPVCGHSLVATAVSWRTWSGHGHGLVVVWPRSRTRPLAGRFRGHFRAIIVANSRPQNPYLAKG